VKTATVPARISIVTLGVRDLAASTAFYEALGWERTSSSNEQIVWFRTTGSALGLFPWHELAADANRPGEPAPAFGGVTLAINVEREADVAAALDVALAAGGTLLRPARRIEAIGVTAGYFADPDGHPWEVAWNPAFPLDERGEITIP
jgi:catechol 2,3-dioxygenase-like lactoylglutathione lyase family enzyme